VPRVSVILPTYNRADVLDRAVASVLAQTCSEWELLVVDDCSDDTTADVVASYADPRVRFIPRSSNGGVSRAQNTGIDRAEGEFVAFLHSDDEFFPDKLDHQLELIDASPRTIGAAESGIEVVWPDRVERWSPGLQHADARDVLSYRARVHTSGLLVRREVAASLRFDERLRGAEDRDFCVRLLRGTGVTFSGETLSRVWKVAPSLAQQDMAPFYAYLLEKYRDDIVPDRRLHADWQYRIARAHARAGHMPEAREALRRAVQLHPARARRWPLWSASFCGDRVCQAAFRIQTRLSDRSRARVLASRSAAPP
jgi:glycosyltransferase involved in cell wall biosynthesis